MALTPQRYIIRLKEKAWYCSKDLVEAIIDEDWQKVISVIIVLEHIAGVQQLIEPYWVPLPTPEEMIENE